MAINLLQMMSSAIGPQLVGQAGRFLGASESTTQSAVDAALPALLGGLMQKGSTASGAATLMSLLNTPGLDPGMVGNLGSFLGGGEKTNALLKLGGSLLPGIFGDRTGSLVNSIGAISGLSSSSASNFMALVVAMVLAFLKKHVTQNRLDGAALTNLLAGQADSLRANLDGRIASALGFASPLAFLSSLTGAAGRARGGGLRPPTPRRRPSRGRRDARSRGRARRGVRRRPRQGGRSRRSRHRRVAHRVSSPVGSAHRSAGRCHSGSRRPITTTQRFRGIRATGGRHRRRRDHRP